jgi:hypothetical protein
LRANALPAAPRGHVARPEVEGANGLNHSAAQQAGAGQGVREWTVGVGRRVMAWGALAGEGSGQSL